LASDIQLFVLYSLWHSIPAAGLW